MPLYVVPRTRAWLSEEEVAAATDCVPAVNATLSEHIRWIRSYIVGEDDGTFSAYCVYEASRPRGAAPPRRRARPADRRDQARDGHDRRRARPRARHRAPEGMARTFGAVLTERRGAHRRPRPRARVPRLAARRRRAARGRRARHGRLGQVDARAGLRDRGRRARRDARRRRRPRDRADARGLPRRPRAQPRRAGERRCGGARRAARAGRRDDRHRRAPAAHRRVAAPGAACRRCPGTRASSWRRATRRARRGGRRSASCCAPCPSGRSRRRMPPRCCGARGSTKSRPHGSTASSTATRCRCSSRPRRCTSAPTRPRTRSCRRSCRSSPGSISTASTRRPARRSTAPASCAASRSRSWARCFPDAAPQDVFARLAALPFVELGREGLVVHDTVREAVAALLRATDPVRHRAHRRDAWRQIRREIEAAAGPARWASLADMIALVDEPLVREAFFPLVDPALRRRRPRRAGDGPAIEAIAARHEPAEEVALLRAWWEAVPSAFRVARSPRGEIVAFTVLCDLGDVPRRLLASDPVCAPWRAHLRTAPGPARPADPARPGCAGPRHRRGVVAVPGRAAARHGARVDRGRAGAAAHLQSTPPAARCSTRSRRWASSRSTARTSCASATGRCARSCATSGPSRWRAGSRRWRPATCR